MNLCVENLSYSFDGVHDLWKDVSLAVEKGDIFSIWKNKKDGIELFLFGALGMLFTQYGYFVAIKYSNAATATVLEYLMPILIVAWYCLKYRRLPYKKELF